jgi:hypothetical protein
LPRRGLQGFGMVVSDLVVVRGPVVTVRVMVAVCPGRVTVRVMVMVWPRPATVSVMVVMCPFTVTVRTVEVRTVRVAVFPASPRSPRGPGIPRFPAITLLMLVTRCSSSVTRCLWLMVWARRYPAASNRQSANTLSTDRRRGLIVSCSRLASTNPAPPDRTSGTPADVQGRL